MSSDTSFDVRPMTRDDVPAYLAFARAAYGPYAYQAQARYLRWLYETPASLGRGYEDAKLAVDGGEVVGCIHKMRCRVRTGDELAELACPHNLFVNESHRHGAGLALIMESFKDEKHIFLMGVMPPVTAIYEKLRCTPIPAYWHRAILNPLTALVAYPMSRIAPYRADATVDFVIDLACRLGRSGSCRVSRVGLAGDGTLAPCALNLPTNCGTTASWDEAAIAHRFAHDDAPRHLVFHFTRGTHLATTVVSVGFHRGFVVARIVECVGSSAHAVRLSVVATRRILALAGANVLLGYTTSHATHLAFCDAGFGVLQDAPRSYQLARRGGRMHSPIEFGAGVGDFGFEGIRLDREPSVDGG